MSESIAITIADNERPSRDPILEDKFTACARSLDILLSNIDSLNWHAVDVSRYMGRVKEVAEELVIELVRLKKRIIVPAPRPALTSMKNRRVCRQKERALIVQNYQRRITAGTKGGPL